MRIALEEHFVMNEPEHIDRWRSVGEARLEAMAKAVIDMAVLSDAGIVQNVLDPTPALRLARKSNDYLATVVQLWRGGLIKG